MGSATTRPDTQKNGLYRLGDFPFRRAFRTAFDMHLRATAGGEGESGQDQDEEQAHSNILQKITRRRSPKGKGYAGEPYKAVPATTKAPQPSAAGLDLPQHDQGRRAADRVAGVELDSVHGKMVFMCIAGVLPGCVSFS